MPGTEGIPSAASHGAEVKDKPALRRRSIGGVSRKKNGNACIRCREKKIKCSGDLPCANCVRRSSNCVFPDNSKKVRVYERYLQELESAARSQSLETPVAAIRNEAAEENLPTVSNPLTGSQYFFLVDSAGKQRYLGSSSSWSFSWQVRSFLKAVVGDESVNLTPNSEEDTYKIASTTCRSQLSVDAEAYPSSEYAEHLVNTALFHVGSTYHLFDIASFKQKLSEFYTASDNDREIPRLWNVQLLLVIALGKMFLGKGSSEFGPPGATDFLRSLKMKRDILEYHEDPLLSIEIHCLRALYLFSADMRDAAYATIGQALRLALSLGMNRDPSTSPLPQAEQNHRRRLWWTVYILDRKLSINLGAPLSIQDEDIDVELPVVKGSMQADLALSLHARLAILEGQVMKASFKINSKIDKDFIKGIEDVFCSMTKLSESFDGRFSLNLTDPSSVNRTASTLHIMYYQCTVMLTRPIMFSICQRRLSNGIQGPSSERVASDAVVAILQTCIGAAITNIKILKVLHEQDLLEPFLPFDLQAVFSAAFILLLSTIAYPALAIDASSITTAESLLGWMVTKGNKPAVSRLMDLKDLRRMSLQIAASSNPLYPLSNSAAITDSTNWLWNALDIGFDGEDSRLTMDGADLLNTDAFGDGSFGNTFNEDWFWAGPTEWSSSSS